MLDPIRNFSAAPFTFTTTGVKNANGTAAPSAQPATGHRVDQDGNTIAGGGGTFTVNANGALHVHARHRFRRSRQRRAPSSGSVRGAATRVAVDFTLHGVNTSTDATRDFGGSWCDLTRQADNSFTQSPAADFSDYGSSSEADDRHTIFPDLKGFVTEPAPFHLRGQPAAPRHGDQQRRI